VLMTVLLGVIAWRLHVMGRKARKEPQTATPA